MKRITVASLALAGIAALSPAQMKMGQMNMEMGTARYGGPTYTGAPKLDVTASVVKNGGGPGHFSVAKGVVAIAGTKTANAEFAKLTKQYGKERVGRFVQIFDFAVADAVKIATAAKVSLPEGKMNGLKLGETLVRLGMDKDGTFYTEYFLDHLLSHKIHMAVMDDIDKKFGEDADRDYHRIANQAYYDLAKLLKIKNAKLAKLH